MDNIQDRSKISTKIFEAQTKIKTTMDAMIAFHSNPDALSQLTPPPIYAQIKEDQRSSLTEGSLQFILWFGPIPVEWHAEHQEGPTQSSFADLMQKGPMQYWRHEHIFEETEDGILLTDRITLAHKAGFMGILTRLFFDGLPLKILFLYRHWRTRFALRKSRSS